MKILIRFLVSLAVGTLLSLSLWHFIVPMHAPWKGRFAILLYPGIIVEAVRALVLSGAWHKQSAVYMWSKSDDVTIWIVNALFYGVLIFIAASYVSRRRRPCKLNGVRA